MQKKNHARAQREAQADPSHDRSPSIIRPSKQGTSEPATSLVLDAALLYLKKGWRPIPIVAGGKTPLLPSWEEYQHRSPSEAEVTEWFTRTPDANIAILTGQASALVAIDVDGPAGDAELHKLCPDVRTLTNVTGKGRHLLFQHPGVQVPNRVRVLPGIDIRADGGYIVAPPSTHDSGKQYQWADGADAWLHADTPLPRCPTPLLAAVQRKRSLDDPQRAIPPGRRNGTLASLAGSLRRRGLSEEVILAALKVTNETRCMPPLPDFEVAGIAASIAKYPPGEIDSVRQDSIDVRKDFRPRLVGDLLAEPDEHEDADWILKGYAARGNLTLLSGHPKAGKTTFAAHLAVAVARGGVLLNRSASLSRVLWLDLEQHLRHTKAMFRKLGAQDLPIFLHSAPIWEFSLDEVSAFVNEQEIGLVVVDSLSRLWKLADENDAVQVVRETRGLMSLARESDAAVLLIHHLRKSGGTQGLDTRGSGALSAAVDISVQFRLEGEGSTRLLESQSRYEETPGKLYTDLEGEKYVVQANEQEVRYRQQRPRILAVLLDWLTPDEVAEATALPVGTVRPVLVRMVEEQLVDRRNKGVKGDPHQYRRREQGDDGEKASLEAGPPPPSSADREKFCDPTIGGCRSENANETRNPLVNHDAEAAPERADDD